MAPRPPYVTEADIRALGLSPADIRHAVADGFLGRAGGAVDLPAKVGVHSRAGSLQHAMPVVLGDLAAVKWISIGSQPGSAGRYIHSELILSDAVSGATIAIMDAGWLTGLRTAAVSALAAEKLVRTVPNTLTILGAGLQARTHIAALRDVFPLRRLRVASRRPESISALADDPAAHGLVVDVIAPEALLRDCELLLTATSGPRPARGLLDAREIDGAAFVIAVDLAVSWDTAGFSAFDAIVTDDRAHTLGLTELGSVSALPRIDADLAGLCAGEPPPTGRRILFLAPGVALADIAVARLVAERLSLLPAGRCA